ncbi:MAG TPA: hypothetical protein VH300_10140 [Thermoleophilaceae bacterium]|jgi:hypothetical protein|nr:hypothetical protein [Thermoleophilaceae bacterium]
MEQRAYGQSPVLHYLAVARAARDFGLDPDKLDRLAMRFVPTPDSVASFADAVADALLERD